MLARRGAAVPCAILAFFCTIAAAQPLASAPIAPGTGPTGAPTEATGGQGSFAEGGGSAKNYTEVVLEWMEAYKGQLTELSLKGDSFGAVNPARGLAFFARMNNLNTSAGTMTDSNGNLFSDAEANAKIYAYMNLENGPYLDLYYSGVTKICLDDYDPSREDPSLYLANSGWYTCPVHRQCKLRPKEDWTADGLNKVECGEHIDLQDIPYMKTQQAIVYHLTEDVYNSYNFSGYVPEEFCETMSNQKYVQNKGVRFKLCKSRDYSPRTCALESELCCDDGKGLFGCDARLPHVNVGKGTYKSLSTFCAASGYEEGFEELDKCYRETLAHSPPVQRDGGLEVILSHALIDTLVMNDVDSRIELDIHARLEWMDPRLLSTRFGVNQYPTIIPEELATNLWVPELDVVMTIRDIQTSQVYPCRQVSKTVLRTGATRAETHNGNSEFERMATKVFCAHNANLPSCVIQYAPRINMAFDIPSDITYRRFPFDEYELVVDIKIRDPVGGVGGGAAAGGENGGDCDAACIARGASRNILPFSYNNMLKMFGPANETLTTSNAVLNELASYPKTNNEDTKPFSVILQNETILVGLAKEWVSLQSRKAHVPYHVQQLTAAASPPGKPDVLEVRVALGRNSSHFVVFTVVPLMLLSTLSTLVFWLTSNGPHFNSRFTISIVCILTATNMNNNLSGQVPHIDDSGIVQELVVLSIIFPGIAMIMCMHVSSLMMKKMTSRANAFDRQMQILMPASYFFFTTCLFIARYSIGWVTVVLSVAIAVTAMIVILWMIHRQRLVELFDKDNDGILTHPEEQEVHQPDLSVKKTVKELRYSITSSVKKFSSRVRAGALQS